MASKLNILIITPAYHPSSFGGIKTHVVNLSIMLAKNGHNITVCTSNAFNFSRNMDLVGEKFYEGVRIIYFNNYFPKRYWFTPGIIGFLKKYISDFDVVHLHNNYSFSNAVAFFYLKKYNIPYVFTPHGSLPVRKRNRFLKSIYNRLIANKIVKSAHRTIALNGLEYQQFLDFGVPEDKIITIPNGVHLNEYKKLPDKSLFRKKFSIANDEMILMFLGRIHQIKGLEILLHSFSKIRTNYKKIRLVIVGPDFGFLDKCHELGKRLKVHNNIIYTGPLFGNEKNEALASCDVFILPSFYDTFPIAVLEACACGKPIIITDRVGISNHVDGQAGISVSYDVDELAEAIRVMMNDKIKRNTFAQGARELVRESFDFEKIIKRYINLYTDADCSKGVNNPLQ